MTRFMFLVAVTVLWMCPSAGKANGSPMASVPNVFNRYVVNSGQWPDEVLAMKAAPGMTVWVTTNGWVYDQSEPSVNGEQRQGNATVISLHANNVLRTASNVTLKGTDTVYRIGGAPLILADSVIRSFGEYTVVDYLDDGDSRYDVHCSIGARVANMHLAFEGHSSLGLEDGSLVITTPLGVIKQSDLNVYALHHAKDMPRQASFTVTENRVMVQVAGDDGRSHIVVDPIVRSSYAARCCLVVSDVAEVGDEFYAVGAFDDLASFPFPKTPGTYTAPTKGATEGFVMVFSRDLTTLIRATLVGGNGADRFLNIVPLGDTAIAMVGSSASTDYPTTDAAPQRVLGGGSDGVITVLTTDLRTLIFSTYHGGPEDDACVSALLDAEGSLLVTGSTRNFGYPEVGGRNRGNANGSDMGIARFATSPWRLERSFNVGGNGNDQVNSALLLSDGTIAFLGQSASGFPLPENGQTPQKPSSTSIDALVFRMNSALDTILSATWVGGAGVDGFWSGVQQDDGTIVVLGSSSSANVNGLTPNAMKTESQSEGDMLLFAFDATLSRGSYGSFLGGSQPDYPHTLGGSNLAIMPTKEVVVLGLSQSSNYPLSSPSSDSTFAVHDMVLTMLRPSLDSILFSTFIGGSDQEGAITSPISGGMVVTSDSLLLVGTQTRSLNFPTTANAYQTDNPGFAVGVVFTYSPYAIDNIAKSPSVGCVGTPVDVRWNYSGPSQKRASLYLAGEDTTLLVASVLATSGQARFNVPDLPPGSYVIAVQVEGAGGTFVRTEFDVLPSSRLQSADTIRFDQGETSSDVEVTFQVSGTESVLVTDIDVIAGTATVLSADPAFPAQVQAGQRLNVRVRIPRQSGSVSLRALTGSCATSDTVLLVPTSSSAVTVRVLDATFSVASVGADTLRVVTDPPMSQLRLQGIDSMTVGLRYSTLFMVPEDSRTWTNDVSPMRTVTITRALEDEADDVLTIPMLALLGPDTVTTVAVSDVVFSLPATITAVDGTIRMAGHCFAGGLRAVVAQGTPQVLRVAPNPASTEVTLMLNNMTHVGPYSIVDNVGQIVASGYTSGTVPVANLQTGTYAVHTGSARTMMVIHR